MMGFHSSNIYGVSPCMSGPVSSIEHSAVRQASYSLMGEITAKQAITGMGDQITQ
jgi:hypothetical protein